VRTDCKHSRITGKPEVMSSPVGLVPINALVLTGLANFRVVGNSETDHSRPESLKSALTMRPLRCYNILRLEVFLASCEKSLTTQFHLIWRFLCLPVSLRTFLPVFFLILPLL